MFESFVLTPPVENLPHARLLAGILLASGLPSRGRNPITIGNQDDAARFLPGGFTVLDSGLRVPTVDETARTILVDFEALRLPGGSPRFDLINLVKRIQSQRWRILVAGGRSGLSKLHIQDWLERYGLRSATVLARSPHEFRSEPVIAKNLLSLLNAERLTPAFSIASGLLSSSSWRTNGLATFQVSANN